MNYGLTMVYGSFGSGKTFGTFLQLYEQEINDENSFIISNVPYGKVSLFWSGEEQLVETIKLLEIYMYSTNKNIKNYSDNISNYKDVIFVIDEAHLTFDARESLVKGNNMKNLSLILTQCRKRKIKFYIVTQRLSNIDLRFKKLSDYALEYTRKSFFTLIEWVRKKEFENLGDISDLETDTVMRVVDGESINYKKESLLNSSLFRPLTTFFNIFVFANKAYRDIIKEQHLTYYVVGFPDEQTNVSYFKDNNNFIFSLVKEQYRKYFSRELSIINIIDANPVLEAFENVVHDDELPAFLKKAGNGEKLLPPKKGKRLFIKN